jgi:uncharacterized membrane protein
MPNIQDRSEVRAGGGTTTVDSGPAAATRSVMRWIMMALYVIAGIGHLTLTDKFLMIVPDWVPFPRETVLFTGVCEIAGGIALLSVACGGWRG